MKAKIHWTDISELARTILDLPSNADDQEIEDKLFEDLDVSMDQFHAIVERLAPLTMPARALVSGEAFRGFVKDDLFIVKVSPSDIV